jgi:hypothetical protein
LPLLMVLPPAAPPAAADTAGLEEEGRPPVVTATPPPPSGPGISLQAGGGVVSYTRNAVDVITDAGGAWDVRVVIGTRRLFAVDLAYIGLANPINLPQADGATLVGHGAEAALRVKLPIYIETAYMTPFLSAGLGWLHYGVVDGALAAPAFQGTDDVATVPLGGGFTVGDGHLFLEVRATYRFTFFDDLARSGDSRDRRGQLGHWLLGASIGVAL